MGQIITLMLLTIFSFTGAIVGLTAFPEVVLPPLARVFCDAGQTLAATFPFGDGLFACLAGGEAVRDVTVPVLLAAFAPTAIFGGLMVIALVTNGAARRRILTTGERGVGRVTSVSYTGVQVNNQPVYKVEMEVYTLNHPPYSVTTRKRSGFYGIAGPQFSPGSLLAVRIDPRDDQNVLIADNEQPDPMLVKQAGGHTTVVSGPAAMQTAQDLLGQFMSDFTGADFTGSVSGGKAKRTPEDDGASLSERLRELKQAYDDGLITQQEYEAGRKRLIEGA